MRIVTNRPLEQVALASRFPRSFYFRWYSGAFRVHDAVPARQSLLPALRQLATARARASSRVGAQAVPQPPPPLPRLLSKEADPQAFFHQVTGLHPTKSRLQVRTARRSASAREVPSLIEAIAARPVSAHCPMAIAP
jgi:hypothetical protein